MNFVRVCLFGLLWAIYFGLSARKTFGQGLIFIMLSISQLMLAIGNINRDEEIEKKHSVTIILLVLMAGLCGAICFSYIHKGFTGDRIKNPDSYLLEIEKINGEDQHTLELEKGDVLVVYCSVDRGSLNVEIAGPDGQIVYVGNEKNNVDEFKVNVLESGKYTIDVEAHHAKGRISVVKE